MKTASIIGRKIRLLRDIRKLSQSRLAKQIDTTQKSISRWENGKQLCQLKFLVRMCKVYHIDWSFFNPINTKTF